MDWDLIRTAVFSAIETCTGIRAQDIQLETDRGGHSLGRRCRVDFDETAPHPDSVIYEIVDGGVEPVVVGVREIGVSVRFFSDDHRQVNEAWAFGCASKLVARVQLPHVHAMLAIAGLAYLRADSIVSSPPQLVGNPPRQMSVASVRLVLSAALYERASDPPAADPAIVDYFDRVELEPDLGADGDAPFIVPSPHALPDDLSGIAWDALWVGGDVDVVAGRVLELSGGATADESAGALTISGAAQLAACDDRELGQLLPGQAVVLISSGPAPAGLELLAGRSAGGLGWDLRANAAGAVQLSVFGSGGTNTGSIAASWSASPAAFVVWASDDGAEVELHATGASVAVAIAGSHLVPPVLDSRLSLGAVAGGTAAPQLCSLLGQVVTTDPAALLAAVEAASGL